ncbi:DUF4974 domain-containing protein [Chitinophaga polysaccharea]|uniref:FecR family protein n=1 Tax=Chitinophaga polysaccharea TaxID=1293035 RepID=UPI0014559D9B|nr:FecR family protein [Chitinophaga polysaccharea]NLR59140.1 DUF4974 domain-containing protein [Chitinophaga polysaccharea]
MDDLHKAINNYLAGKATPEERQLVNNWYYATPDDSVEIPADDAALREQIRDRIHHRLQQTLQQNRHPRGRTAFFTPWKVAAAITLLIGCVMGGWQLFRTRAPHPAPLASAATRPGTILPGGNKAVLLLANGDSILLDNAGNGMLSQQGNTRVIKRNNGALTYQAAGETASTAVAYNTLRTPRGGQYQVTLPDGTRVWLNAASSLRFPTTFTGGSREVVLNGEAYFEVTTIHNKNGTKIPFIVKVHHSKADMDVKVLGTKFNVLAYDDEPAVSTALLEGAVLASTHTDSVLIKPGQRANLAVDHPVFKLGAADFREILAWKNGEFHFREAGIKEIMRQLCRWYDVEVVYRSDANNVKLSGIIPKTEDINQLLDALQATGKVHFEVKERKIIVQPL